MKTDWIIYRPLATVEGVVRELRYAVRALDEDGNPVRTHQGVARLGAPDPLKFVPAEELQDSTLLAWVFAFTNKTAAEALVVEIARNGKPGSRETTEPEPEPPVASEDPPIEVTNPKEE